MPQQMTDADYDRVIAEARASQEASIRNMIRTLNRMATAIEDRMSVQMPATDPSEKAREWKMAM